LASLRSALAAALRSAGPASRPAGQSACALAFALAQLDEPAECRARARECVAIGHAGNHGYLEIDGTVLAARCTLALDDAAEAERLAQHAIVLAEGSPSYARALAEAEVELGRARAALGRTPEARRAFARALVDARTALQARNAVSGMLALPR
ncbi:MAG TPA: hypothetical protein VG755_13605, partial [Nannocystaceae bacterium]|nr:hypothetical protein [Nannocystaceae bacterium]